MEAFITQLKETEAQLGEDSGSPAPRPHRRLK
jgi:hypothetical protein